MCTSSEHAFKMSLRHVVPKDLVIFAKLHSYGSTTALDVCYGYLVSQLRRWLVASETTTNSGP